MIDLIIQSLDSIIMWTDLAKETLSIVLAASCHNLLDAQVQELADLTVSEYFKNVFVFRSA